MVEFSEVIASEVAPDQVLGRPGGAMGSVDVIALIDAAVDGTATEAQLSALAEIVDTHTSDDTNPHEVTASQVGLGNVDNTSDAAKPISDATQAALNTKADLESGVVPYEQLTHTAPAPIKIVYPMSSNITLAGDQAGVWVDVDPSGTAAARLLDVVFDGCRPGDTIEIEPHMASLPAAGNFMLDMFTVVDGVAVSRFGVGAEAVASTPWTTWAIGPNQWDRIQNARSLVVRADDIDDVGRVRCRLRRYYLTGGARALLNTWGWQTQLIGRGPYRARHGTLVLFDGQSGNHSSPPNTYPVQAMDGLAASFDVVGISGLSWTTLATTADVRMHDRARQHRNTVLVLWGGVTDMWPGGEGDTPEQAVADMEAYADAARAAGVNKIVALTITPSTTYLPSEPDRLTANNLIKASTSWEAVADVASDPRLQDATDLVYFYDGTHPTEAGNAVVAEYVAPILEAML